MSENIRLLALESLLLIRKGGRKSNEITDAVLDKYANLSGSERAFYLRLVRGTLENTIRSDMILDVYSGTPTAKMKPVIREILRMAVYQIEKMDSVPDRAAVDEAVRLAVKKGFGSLKGFVNGVLRSYLREPERFREPGKEQPSAYLQARYSVPAFLADKWIGRYGLSDAERICASFSDDRGITVRIRRDKEKTLASLKAADITVEKAPYAPDAYRLYGADALQELEALRNGNLIVQDVSSQLAVYAAGIGKGMKILDMCAAPGGKSILAADLTGSTGSVTACDISRDRLMRMEENIRRCGIFNIKTEVRDAADPGTDPEEKADVVLVDAPCSGYGVIGRKCDIIFSASAEKEESLVRLQREILQNAARFVKKGGTLIFSTCTVNETENEGNAAWFLEQFAEQGFAAESLNDYLPGELHCESTEQGQLQLLPGIHNCDGFFIARFVKKSF